LLISENTKTSYILIDRDLCKACHYCIAVCPREIIGVSKEFNRFGVNFAEPIADKAFMCTGCKNCAVMCPDLAITVYRCRVPESETIA